MTAFNAAATTPAAYVAPSGGIVVNPAAPRFARLMSDITKGAWQPSTGNDLYAMLNEVTPDPATYISTTGTDPCEMALEPVQDPGTSKDQAIYVLVDLAVGASIAVYLKQGATLIASKSFDYVQSGFSMLEVRLTSAECDAITDYGDLIIGYKPN